MGIYHLLPARPGRFVHSERIFLVHELTIFFQRDRAFIHLQGVVTGGAVRNRAPARIVPAVIASGAFQEHCFMHHLK